MGRIGLALVTILLSACAAQIKIKTPTAAMISPEALGSLGKFELGGGTMKTPAVEVTADGANRPPDTENPRVIEDDRVNVQAGVGLFSRADLYFDPGAWTNLKLQLLGDPFSTAKRGNFSLSVLGGFAWKDEDGSGKDLDFSKDKGVSVAPNIRYTLKATQWKAGALAGYRLADAFLVYVGAHRQEHRYSGGFDNVAGRDGRYAGFAKVHSANLGIELALGKEFVIRVEDAYSVTTIPGSDDRSSGHFLGAYIAGVFGN